MKKIFLILTFVLAIAIIVKSQKIEILPADNVYSVGPMAGSLTICVYSQDIPWGVDFVHPYYVDVLKIGDDTLQINFEENSSGEERSSTIIITAEGLDSDTIIIKQSTEEPNEIIYLNWDFERNSEYMIFDLSGRRINSGLNLLPRGIYIFIHSKEEGKSEKIFINH